MLSSAITALRAMCRITSITARSLTDAVSGDILNFQKDAGNTWTSLRYWTPNEIQAEFYSNRSKELFGTSQIASPIGVLINIRKK